MKEYWVDQEKFYASLKSDDVFELAKIMAEIEEGFFILFQKVLKMIILLSKFLLL